MLKNILLAIVIGLLLLPITASSETKNVSTQAEFSKSATQATLQSIGKKASDFTSLATDFVQEKQLSIFEKKMVIRGRIYLQKPSRLAWHVDKPLRYSIVITDKTVRQWDEDSNQVQELSLANNQLFKNVLNQLTVWFSGDYASLLDDNEVNMLQKHPLVMEFTPKGSNIAKKMIRNITITFREDEKYLKKIRIRELSGDTTTITFSNTLLNVPVERRFFEITRG